MGVHFASKCQPHEKLTFFSKVGQLCIIISYKQFRRRTQLFPRVKFIWRSVYYCMGMSQGIRYTPCSIACESCSLVSCAYFSVL